MATDTNSRDNVLFGSVPQRCCLNCPTDTGGVFVVECEQCHLSYYCSRKCQTASWPRHLPLCTLACRQRAVLDQLEAELSKKYGKNVVEEGQGYFWRMNKVTAKYSRAMHALGLIYLTIGEAEDNVRAFKQAKDLFLELLRLNHDDPQGVGRLLPFVLLSMNQKQEAYDFIKWHATVDPRGAHQWYSGPRYPKGSWPYCKGEDITEDLMDVPEVRACKDQAYLLMDPFHLTALVIIKLLIIRNLKGDLFSASKKMFDCNMLREMGVQDPETWLVDMIDISPSRGTVKGINQRGSLLPCISQGPEELKALLHFQESTLHRYVVSLSAMAKYAIQAMVSDKDTTSPNLTSFWPNSWPEGSAIAKAAQFVMKKFDLVDEMNQFPSAHDHEAINPHDCFKCSEYLAKKVPSMSPFIAYRPLVPENASWKQFKAVVEQTCVICNKGPEQPIKTGTIRGTKTYRQHRSARGWQTLEVIPENVDETPRKPVEMGKKPDAVAFKQLEETLAEHQRTCEVWRDSISFVHCISCEAATFCLNDICWRQHMSFHASFCGSLKLLKTVVKEEEEILLDESPNFENYFLGMYWQQKEARPFCLSLRLLAMKNFQMGALEDNKLALCVAADHMLELMRLTFVDIQGLRYFLPYAFLLLDRDDECYSTVKWWAVVAADENFDWNNIPRHVKGEWIYPLADVLEDVRVDWKTPHCPTCTLPLLENSFLFVMFLLKLRIVEKMRRNEMPRVGSWTNVIGGNGFCSARYVRLQEETMRQYCRALKKFCPDLFDFILNPCSFQEEAVPRMFVRGKREEALIIAAISLDYCNREGVRDQIKKALLDSFPPSLVTMDPVTGRVRSVPPSPCCPRPASGTVNQLNPMCQLSIHDETANFIFGEDLSGAHPCPVPAAKVAKVAKVATLRRRNRRIRESYSDEDLSAMASGLGLKVCARQDIAKNTR